LLPRQAKLFLSERGPVRGKEWVFKLLRNQSSLSLSHLVR